MRVLQSAWPACPLELSRKYLFENHGIWTFAEIRNYRKQTIDTVDTPFIDTANHTEAYERCIIVDKKYNF